MAQSTDCGRGNRTCRTCRTCRTGASFAALCAMKDRQDTVAMQPCAFVRPVRVVRVVRLHRPQYRLRAMCCADPPAEAREREARQPTIRQRALPAEGWALKVKSTILVVMSTPKAHGMTESGGPPENDPKPGGIAAGTRGPWPKGGHFWGRILNSSNQYHWPGLPLLSVRNPKSRM